jgi:hypothetical protein
MTKTLAPPTPADPPPGPPARALVAGTFVIYPAPDGGVVLVTNTSAHGIQQRHISGKIMRFVTGNSKMAKMFAGIFGGQDEGEG